MRLVSVPGCCSALQGSELKIGHQAAFSEERSQQQIDAGTAAAAESPLCAASRSAAARDFDGKKGKTTKNRPKHSQGFIHVWEENQLLLGPPRRAAATAERAARWVTARRGPRSAPCWQPPPRCAFRSSRGRRRRLLMIWVYLFSWICSEIKQIADVRLLLVDPVGLFSPPPPQLGSMLCRQQRVIPGGSEPQLLTEQVIWQLICSWIHFSNNLWQSYVQGQGSSSSVASSFSSILTYCSVHENGNLMLVWFPWKRVQWPRVFLPSDFNALELCCHPLTICKVLFFFNSEYMAMWGCSDIRPL